MKNEYLVTQKKYVSWGLEDLVKPPKVYMSVFWIILSGLSFLLLLLKASIAFNILIFGYCMYQAFVRDLIKAIMQYRRLAESYEKAEWQRSISFKEAQIAVKDDRSQYSYKYSDLIEVKVRKNKICLSLNNNIVLRLYADTFVDGDWEQCKKLLKEKNHNLKL